jgi:hypothetical protein
MWIMWRDARCTLDDDDVELAADFPSVNGRARVELIELTGEDAARLDERVRSLPLALGPAGEQERRSA